MRIAPIALAVLLAGACASVPGHQYGVESIEWKGVEQMSRESVEACLATKEREPWTIRLGLSQARCGEPPFDVNVPDVGLITWPWTTWPIYDPAIFELDQKRIMRWYAARGFYDARIDGIDYLLDGKAIQDPEQCSGDDCGLTIRVRVHEGEPVRVESVEVTTTQPLPAELLAELRAAPRLAAGERFDEAIYARDKQRLLSLLHEAAFVRAEVAGEIGVDRDKHSAAVRYRIDPGHKYRFGRMRVEGQGDLSAQALIEVANLKPGEPWSDSEIADAEGAVYALGVFSSVRIEPEYRENSDVADLLMRVRRTGTERFRIGAGLMSGTLQHATSGETFDVPEWDVHLLLGYTNQNFLGDMRKLRIEERPRIIFLEQFPTVPPGGAELGNAINVHLEQPRFPERRTVSFIDSTWDYGPDPFFGFFRHDLATRIGVKRNFFRQKLRVALALEHDLYDITTDDAPDTVSSYRLPFAEQQVEVDLRNDDRRPSRGVYLASTLQEAVQLGYGSWDYLRLLPEARAYQRLFWGVVLAERLGFGALFVLDSSTDLDPTSRLLGPNNYRLRGGGATSNRGFAPGTLGAGVDGGKRLWEGTVELRVPLGGMLGTALFFDVGDVSRTNEMRFDHWNASAGLGLRLYTPFAPIRVDAGWRIPALAVLGERSDESLSFLPSAVYLTLGEAF